MKWIKFTRIVGKQNVGTEENPVWEDILTPLALSYCEYNEEIAKAEAYNGEYTIEDDGQPDSTSEPTQLDRVEAQITYTAMMTDTLLEV
jgi:hypothetical protein